MRRFTAIVGAALATAAISGCGSSSGGGANATAAGGNHSGSSSKAVSIDVGTGKPIVVHTTKPRIGFLWTSGNTFLTANLRGAQDEAKKLGLSLTVFDAKFDPQTQLTQVQDVLQQHRFDGLVVVPLDGNTMCPILTKQAPAEGIPVVTMNIPMCNRTTNPEGPGLWSPGTVAQSGFTATVTANRYFFEQVAKRLGPGHHIGALELGPPLIAGSMGTAAALKQVQAANSIPNLDVKYVINTDFTAPDALAKTQALLQAHPDIDTIMTIYSDETVGVIQAVKQAGRTGKVHIFDQGGSAQVLSAIKQGTVDMSVGFFPYTYGQQAVLALANAFAGRPFQRWYGAYIEGSTLGKPFIIDKSTVNKFVPQAQ